MKCVSVFSTFFTFWFTVTSVDAIKSIEDANRENLRKLTLANNEFAFNLHRRLVSGSSENVFFSSLSLSTVFGMLFYGARGNTAEELRDTLGYKKADLPNNLVHDTFNSYMTESSRRGDSSDGNIQNTINAIFIDKQLGVRGEYKRKIKELYRTAVPDVDFRREPASVVRDINSFVTENTNGKINKVLDKLEADTVMVLLNAAYFKGTWKIKFHADFARNETFFNNGQDSEGRRVPFMSVVSRFPYTSVDNIQALELPYKDGNVSMLILLPRERRGLQDLEQSLSPERLKDIQRRLLLTPVQVYMPKFKLEFQKEFSPEIQALGAKQIFRDGADFSGMTSRNNVKVGQVLHKAVIEVNEEGSEDPDYDRGSLNCSPPVFWADHPFLIAILDKGSKSNMILFLGRVNSI